MPWLTLILQNLPAIVQAIVTIEHNFGGKLPGPAKKQLILNAVDSGPEALPDAHIQALSKLIDLEVGTMNANNALSPVKSAS